MIDDRCVGPDLDRLKISPDARVSGASYLTGSRTAVGPGAVVHDSRLHDVVVETSASVVDSIVLAEGQAASHQCDPAGRTVVRGAEVPRIAAGAAVSGCTLINTSVGERARVTDSWASDCQLGSESVVADAKLVLVGTGSRVRVRGPTEVSEAYLGDSTTIERRGYFEGVFSNTFLRLKYNGTSGRLEVVGTIELPHVSRYGANTINSTNSGKLLPQPNGILKGFGVHEGLWRDPLLSHEPIELGPCCWVAPWTKVVGQSPAAHATHEALVNDHLATYVMPLAVAGVGGDLTRGLVMPGEFSTGLGPKQRRGAWVFTYAPDAVIHMVRRLHAALEPSRKHVADTIVVEALQTAIEMIKAMAAGNDVDLAVPPDRQRKGGWPRWIASTYALLTVHLESELWGFTEGRPTQWRQEAGRWTHPRIDRLLAVAPDAWQNQVTEQDIFAGGDDGQATSVALPSGAVQGSAGDAEIDPTAQIAANAFIGPGCRIGPNTIVEGGATVWNSVLQDCRIGAGARIERSVLADSRIGRDTRVRSCRMTDSTMGDDSTADAAAMSRTHLAAKATVSTFADLSEVQTEYGAILGGAIRSAEIGTYLMSMHMAGSCAHLNALPTPVELGGQTVLVPAIPMLGGGSVVRGTEDAPVRMECCFIGSNALIEPGSYIGFGCFVQGTLGPDVALLPLTLSTGSGPEGHQIGGVLGSLPSTVITHFINWAFQAVGPDGAPAVAEMTRQAIGRGIDAIQWELARRSGEAAPADGAQCACRRRLPEYSERQLLAGVRNYQRALEDGAWEIAWDGEQLRFSSENGRWLERDGTAFWKRVVRGS